MSPGEGGSTGAAHWLLKTGVLVVVNSVRQKDCALVVLWVRRQASRGLHHADRIHRNGVKFLLCTEWKGPPNSDRENYCDCDAAQDTHGGTYSG